jgi:protein SCO1/2
MMLSRLEGAFGVGLALWLCCVAPVWSQSVQGPSAQDHAAQHEDQTEADPHAAHRAAAAEADPHAAHRAAAAEADTHAAHRAAAAAPDPHAAHRAALAKPSYSVTSEQYSVPDVRLIDTSGTEWALRSLLESDQPVALNFIFTTCTTICPVMTATFAQMQRNLGGEAKRVQLVSISIDPEYDRPGVLKEYAARFDAGAGWTFLTGDSADILQVLQSFGTYAGSKMNHQPITLLKRPESPSWIRIDGLASGTDLAQEVTARLLN